MAEMATQKSNASERRSRQAQKGQDTEQTHVTAATARIAVVQMQPESSVSEPEKNRTHTAQFIEHMKDEASLPKIRTVQMLHRLKRQMCRRKRSWRGMTEMAMQKPNASERRSRQARKGQDTEQTYVTAVKTGMAAVQMQPESSASEPGKNRRHTMQFIGHMQDTASLPKTHMVQMLHRCHRHQRQMCRRKHS